MKVYNFSYAAGYLIGVSCVINFTSGARHVVTLASIFKVLYVPVYGICNLGKLTFFSTLPFLLIWILIQVVKFYDLPALFLLLSCAFFVVRPFAYEIHP